jgi:hypothetical protein
MPSASDQRVIDVFIGQFTPDGGGYIYRRGQKGQAIRVSAAEYQGFVDDYVRAYRRTKWGLVAGLLITITALVATEIALGVDVDSAMATVSLVAVMAVGIGLCLWLFSRDFNRPARTLDRRAPVGDALSNDAFLRRYFTEMSWASLLVQIGSLTIVSLLVVLKHDVLHGWGRLWLVLPGACLIAAGVGIWRKWRYTDPTP